MKSLKINIPGREYNIYVENGLLARLGPFLAKYEGRRAAVITDENVGRLYGEAVLGAFESAGARAEIITVRPGEESKALSVLEGVYEAMIALGVRRGDIIAALGGGVVGDLAGFAAATFLRGVRYIQIPTTLLAQVDSSVGGKTAVNLVSGKNLVGAFYQPEAVFIDTGCLKTLPERELSCGAAEVIKYGAIKSRELFELLEKNGDILYNIEDTVLRCCKIKGDIVAADEFDKGERMLLNFGHTFGHAIEKQFGFGSWTHGEAVAAGMCIIARYCEGEGLCPGGSADRIARLCESFSLPTGAPGLRADFALNDKKSEGEDLNIVLLRQIGEAFYKKMPRDGLYNILALAGG